MQVHFSAARSYTGTSGTTSGMLSTTPLSTLRECTDFLEANKSQCKQPA